MKKPEKTCHNTFRCRTIKIGRTTAINLWRNLSRQWNVLDARRRPKEFKRDRYRGYEISGIFYQIVKGTELRNTSWTPGCVRVHKTLSQVLVWLKHFAENRPFHYGIIIEHKSGQVRLLTLRQGVCVQANTEKKVK